MSKKIKKRNKWPLAFIALVLIISASVYLMFFYFPSGERVNDYMGKEDFKITADVNRDTPIFGALLPEGAQRSILYHKTLNGELYSVVVIFFEDYTKAKAYYEEQDEPEEGKAAFVRGNAVVAGDEKTVGKLRWIVY